MGGFTIPTAYVVLGSCWSRSQSSEQYELKQISVTKTTYTMKWLQSSTSQHSGWDWISSGYETTSRAHEINSTMQWAQLWNTVAFSTLQINSPCYVLNITYFVHNKQYATVLVAAFIIQSTNTKNSLFFVFLYFLDNHQSPSFPGSNCWKLRRSYTKTEICCCCCQLYSTILSHHYKARQTRSCN